ncbi:MAG: hypothetical protein AMXMBFR84_01490 [Candidatus Hydrogenedentota bacterium]
METLQQAAGGGLAGIDTAVILVYMIGVFFLGSYFGKFVKDAGDYFVAGRTLPFWAIGMSVVVSDIGATDFIGVAGAAYESGIAVANFDWMGSMPAMVFAAFIFIPYYWRSGVYTVPEFLGRRYNGAVQLLHATIWGIFLVITLAMMLYMTADQFMHTILGWNVQLSIWIIAFVAGVYTLSGGLTAVVMTDVVQMVVMFVGGAALLVLALWRADGWTEARQTIVNKPPELIIVVDVPGTNDPSVATAENTIEATLKGIGLDVLGIEPAHGRLSETQTAYSVGISKLLELDAADKTGQITEADYARNTKEKVSEAITAAYPEGTSVEVKLRDFKAHFDILLPNDTPTAFPWSGIVFGLGIVMAMAYMSGNQVIVQRCFGARSEWDAKGGMLFAGFLKSFIPLLVAIPGLLALVHAPALINGDRAVPTMISIMLPPGLRGLMFAALLAALMSSVDSTLSSAAAIWTTDLYARFRAMLTRGGEADVKELLWVGRGFTIAFIVFAALLAEPIFKGAQGIYNMMQSLMTYFQGPIFAILLLGIVWKRANQWGGLAGLVCGVIFNFIIFRVDNLFPSEDPYLYIAIWSFLFSCAVTVVVSLLTKPEPDEKIRGLVFGQVMKDGEVQRVLGERVQ